MVFIINTNNSNYEWIEKLKKLLHRDETQVIKYKELRTYNYIDNTVELIKEYLRENEGKWIRVYKLQDIFATKYKFRIAKPSIRGLVKKVILGKDFSVFPEKPNTDFPSDWWISYKGSLEVAKYRCGVCYTPINKIFHIKENTQDIIRAICPNLKCKTFLRSKSFNRNLVPREITECQYCHKKEPIYLECPTCGLYLCKKCIVYHEKVLHVQEDIPKNVKCHSCKSMYVEIKCILCGNWYCARCFPKKREYTEYWFDDELIENPLEISEESTRKFLDSICIKCIKFNFHCDDCDKKLDKNECKKCIIKSRNEIYRLAKQKLDNDLKLL